VNSIKHIMRLGLAVMVALAIGAPAAPVSFADEPPTTCTADLTIFTTSPGTVTTNGQITRFRDSGVAGQYTSGFLAGYTFTGAQDIVVNNNNNTSQLQGSFTATGPGGSLVIRYSGHADLSTGAATGHFNTIGGTGQFTGFHWSGDITAQLVSLTPPTFQATDSGPCH
jgi:hypothetical protein